MRTRTGILVATVSTLLPPRAFAEVMDKEPTIAQIWIAALVLSAAGVAAWRWRPVIGLAVSLITVLVVFLVAQEMMDPYVAPAILAEAGVGYVRSVWSAVIFCVAVHAAAAMIRMGGWSRRFRRDSGNRSA